MITVEQIERELRAAISRSQHAYSRKEYNQARKHIKQLEHDLTIVKERLNA